MNHIRFTIEKPGEIVAVDNGDAASFESFQGPKRGAFKGLSVAVVGAKSGQSGTITRKGESQGLKSGTVKIKALLAPFHYLKSNIVP
jgi:beta-galactosidase